MMINLDARSSDRARKLFHFLRQFTHLQRKAIGSLDAYEHVLPFSEIPTDLPCCSSRADGPREGEDSDVWFEVRQQKEPSRPDPPGVCLPWVDEASLDEGNPRLRPSIEEEVPAPDGDDDSGPVMVTKYLDDHPEVIAAWEKWLEDAWRPWTKSHDEWQRAHDVYMRLFQVYQDQKRLGEQYELVVGVGLLHWRLDHGTIRRHLLVADAELEFDAERARFLLRVHPDGSRLRPELDMLPPGNRPQEAAAQAREVFRLQGEDPWDRSVVEPQLESLAHSLAAGGQYDGSLEMVAGNAPTSPRVTFSPALILRKRSVRGYEENLERLDALLQKEGVAVSAALATVLGATEEPEIEEGEGRAGEPRRLWLPKPANEDQQRVVGLAMQSGGVLVQGPPGTGKSHTIANLICHALAEGQRILVTAQTPRALAVLHRLLPGDTGALAISLLGRGMEERHSLEHSVKAILERSGRWNPDQVRKEVAGLEKQLEELGKKLARDRRQLEDLRSGEAREHVVGDGTYRGTPSGIARKLKADEDRYGWIPDRPDSPDQCPVDPRDLQEVLAGLRKFTPDYVRELGKELPTELPSARPLLAREGELKTWLEDHEGRVDREIVRLGEELVQKDLEDLLSALVELRQKVPPLLPPEWNWEPEALRSLARSGRRFWKALGGRTGKWLAEFDEKDAERAERSGIVFREDLEDLRKAARDARALVEHVEAGGKLGILVFRPAVVKERMYLLRSARVNGHSPATLDELREMETVLRVRACLEEARRAWRKHVPEWPGDLPGQRRQLAELGERLGAILELAGPIERIVRVLAAAKAQPPTWDDPANLQRWVDGLEFDARRRELARVRGVLSRMASELEEWNRRCPDLHPVFDRLVRALRSRSLEEWDAAEEKWKKLLRDRELLEVHRKKLEDLRKILPKLTELLERTCGDGAWDRRVREVAWAWQWALARGWLDRHLSADAGILQRRIARNEREVLRTTGRIAELRAWRWCVERLTSEHLQHMNSWELAVRRLGKGTGKHAPRYRRMARESLEKCRDAIPAWIMPIHRVWDTIDVAPGIFDLVVVDEASQCGIDTLPLLLLGKRLVVVGDDQQISPEGVGVNIEDVDRLRRDVVADFPNPIVFDPRTSLYDVAKIYFGKRQVTLREHFRCMPEIIEFSNRHFYSGELVPLRQYGKDRLPPLQGVFVPEGHREGGGASVINRPEAERIVETIRKLCDDPRYRDKTMGVIALQGKKQASLIEKLLAEALPAKEIEERRLVCGDPYSFQGDERDVMFLSLVAAPNARIGAMTTEARGRSFNVAASRAKDQEWLFYSVDLADLSPECFRYKLLEHFKRPPRREVAGISVDELGRVLAGSDRARERPPEPFESWFEVEVALRIARKGYRVVPQHEVAGYRIDLVVVGSGSRLAVECDGEFWHGPERFAADMARQRVLERCGWQFYRVREAAFVDDPERALEPLWNLLEQCAIFPEEDDPREREPVGDAGA